MLRATAMALNRIGGGGAAASRSLLFSSPALSAASSVPSSSNYRLFRVPCRQGHRKGIQGLVFLGDVSGFGQGERRSCFSSRKGVPTVKRGNVQCIFRYFFAAFFLVVDLNLDSHFSSTIHTPLQAKAVDSVMKDINARFGKGSIMFLGGEPEKM